MAEQMMQETAGKAIPAGYKQTEVGVIPEDWALLTIDDVASFSGGAQPAKTFFSSKPKDGYIRLIQIRDYKTSEYETYIPGTLARKLCSEYDIMIGRYGPPIFQILKGIRGAYNVALIKAEPKKLIEREYLFYYLKTDKLFSLMDMLSQRSSGQTGVELPALKAYPIPLPPKQEQTAIANVLSDSDALIDALEQLIAKKQAVKSATMQQLLTGRTRLLAFALRPDGTPKGYKPSELGDIPEDWEVFKFDQIKDRKDSWAITGGPFGSNLKASDYTENGVRVIQLQNIGDGFFKNDDFVFTSLEKADELRSCNIYPNEIILSKMGDPVARACLIPNLHDRYVMCSDGIRLKVDGEKHSEKFVFYFLNSPMFRNQALDASTGSTRKRIGLSELRVLLLFAPSKNEQTAIATILSDMDNELQALTQKLEKARALKQGMMQQLLTGKIRLPLAAGA